MCDPVSETRHQSQLLPYIQPKIFNTRIIEQGNLSVDPASIHLAEVGFILSAGNGVKEWSTFHLASKILGGNGRGRRVAVAADKLDTLYVGPAHNYTISQYQPG